MGLVAILVKPIVSGNYMDVFSINKKPCMFNICFIHNLAEVDHFKSVSFWCYAPRAMFSYWLVNKRIPPREDSQS